MVEKEKDLVQAFDFTFAGFRVQAGLVIRKTCFFSRSKVFFGQIAAAVGHELIGKQEVAAVEFNLRGRVGLGQNPPGHEFATVRCQGA